MSLNNCTFSGNIGQDAQVKSVGSTTVANFSVAVNRRKKNGEDQEPIWVNCALWGKRAESRLIDYLKRGQTVIVSGEIDVRTYEGKNGAGVSTDLNVKDLELVGGKRELANDEIDPAEGL